MGNQQADVKTGAKFRIDKIGYENPDPGQADRRAPLELFHALPLNRARSSGLC